MATQGRDVPACWRPGPQDDIHRGRARDRRRDSGRGRCRTTGATNSPPWGRESAARERRALSSDGGSGAGHDVDGQARHDARLSERHMRGVHGNGARTIAGRRLVERGSSRGPGPLLRHLRPGCRGAHGHSSWSIASAELTASTGGFWIRACRTMAPTVVMRATSAAASTSLNAAMRKIGFARARPRSR